MMESGKMIRNMDKACLHIMVTSECSHPEPSLLLVLHTFLLLTQPLQSLLPALSIHIFLTFHLPSPSLTISLYPYSNHHHYYYCCCCCYRYEGGFKNGKFDGQGKQTYRRGDIYEGSYSNDKKNGEGTLTYANGQVFKGTFVNGKKEGKGMSLPRRCLNDYYDDDDDNNDDRSTNITLLCTTITTITIIIIIINIIFFFFLLFRGTL
jgi:hypothetical protein